MVYKMALKNLLRHKKRTMLTLITSIVGIFLAVIGEGLNSGLEVQATDLSIKSEISYGRIFAKDFYAEKEDNNILEFPIDKNIEKDLAGIPFSRRITFGGSITNSEEELGVNYIGVNKISENVVFEREKYITQGDFLNEPMGIVIGYDLANLLNLKTGDQITLMARTVNKSQNAYDAIITGILKTGNPIFDSRTVFLNEEFAKEFSGADFYNEYVIGKDLDNKKIEQLKTKNIDYITYKEALKDIMSIASLRRKIFGIISFAILLMAALTITNTMLMAMLERKKEVGVLMANGMNGKKVLKMYFFEGFLNGAIGCIIGFLMGTVIVVILQKVGIPFNINVNDLGVSIPFSDRLYLHYNFKTSIIFPFVGLLFASIASFYPAYRATKLNPVEAIKG